MALVVKAALVTLVVHYRRQWQQLHGIEVAAAHEVALYHAKSVRLVEQRDDALARLAMIAKLVTRRPPRRRWLALTHKVARASGVVVVL